MICVVYGEKKFQEVPPEFRRNSTLKVCSACSSRENNDFIKKHISIKKCQKLKTLRLDIRKIFEHFWDRKISKNFDPIIFEIFHWKLYENEKMRSKILEIFDLKIFLMPTLGFPNFLRFQRNFLIFFIDPCKISVRSEWRYLERSIYVL